MVPYQLELILFLHINDQLWDIHKIIDDHFFQQFLPAVVISRSSWNDWPCDLSEPNLDGNGSIAVCRILESSYNAK